MKPLKLVLWTAAVLLLLASTGQAQRIVSKPLVQAPDPLWDSGKEQFDKGEFAKAIEIWTRQVESPPPGLSREATAQRLFMMSVACFRSGQYEKATEWGKKALPLAEAAEKELAGQRPTSQIMAARLALAGGGAVKRTDCLQVVWRSYLMLNQYPRVAGLFKEAIDRNPNDDLLFRLLSQAAMEAKRPEEALAPAKRAVELNAANPGNQLALGRAHYGRRDYDAAVQALQAALAAHPAFTPAQMALGQIHLARLEFAKAAEAFGKAAYSPSGNPPESLFVNACRYYLGRYDDVLAGTDRLMGLGQEAAKRPGWLGMGSLDIDATTARALQLGETGGALVTLLAPQGPAERAGIRRGDIIATLGGSPARSQKEIGERLKALGQGSPVKVGVIRQGKPVELEAVPGIPPALEEMMTLVPPEAAKATALALRSLAARARGEAEEAEKLATAALTAKNTLDLAILAAGLSRLDRGSPQAARTVLETLAPESLPGALLHARIAQASAWLKEGNLDKAYAAYLLADRPIHPEWKPLWGDRQAFLQAIRPRVMERIRSAVELEKKGRLQEALDAIAWASLFTADEQEAGQMRNAMFALVRKMKAPPAAPEESRRHFVKGKLLLKDGGLEEALGEFRLALALAPYSEELYYNSALICEKLKAYGEAIRYMTVFVQSSTDEQATRTAKDKIIEWGILLEKTAKEPS